MKELIMKVPEDAVDFVEELVERIGGTIETASNKRKRNSNKTKAKLLPLDFFGNVA